jgi:hypothetical protein
LRLFRSRIGTPHRRSPGHEHRHTDYSLDHLAPDHCRARSVPVVDRGKWRQFLHQGLKGSPGNCANCAIANGPAGTMQSLRVKFS